MVSFHVVKPELPLLWLDTSALIDITKADKGRVVHTVIRPLAEIIREKMSEGKLVCLKSDQLDEMAGHPRREDIWLTLERLSWSIRIMSLEEIEEQQVYFAMKSYIRNSSTVTIPANAFLYEDPQAISNEVRKKGMWVTCAHSEMSEEDKQSAKRIKECNWHTFEEKRQENIKHNRTFDEQLRIEQDGAWQILQWRARRYQQEIQVAGERPEEANYALIAKGDPLYIAFRRWVAIGGDDGGFPGFYASEHFHGLPFNHIRDHLFAKILTSRDAVKPSDLMDVSHMSAALPIAKWVFADKAMRHRVETLRLDRHWGAEVFSYNTASRLINRIQQL